MEKTGYREVYEQLQELFPDRATISVNEAAQVLGVSPGTVYSAVRRAKNPLPSKKLGATKVVIPIAALARWMV